MFFQRMKETLVSLNVLTSLLTLIYFLKLSKKNFFFEKSKYFFLKNQNFCFVCVSVCAWKKLKGFGELSEDCQFCVRVKGYFHSLHQIMK